LVKYTRDAPNLEGYMGLLTDWSYSSILGVKTSANNASLQTLGRKQLAAYFWKPETERCCNNAPTGSNRSGLGHGCASVCCEEIRELTSTAYACDRASISLAQTTGRQAWTLRAAFL